ncbi:MAG: regulatory protein TetR [Chitinophagaceae bacterium]|nr:regulatory protein TetR [Chitinophagaceae bacterium]
MNVHLYLPIMRIKDEQKIDAIHEKAVETIVKYGFDGLSMQKLAKAANVSPATIYIYFKDRDDLIQQVATKEAAKMVEASLKGFDATMPFAEGLTIQWKNRAKYWLKHPQQAKFLEQVRHSPVGEEVYSKVKKEFSLVMSEFVKGAVKRRELIKLPIEVYWAVAFAPFYQLVKFHDDGKSMSGQPFKWSDAYMNQTLKLVIKALTP